MSDMAVVISAAILAGVLYYVCRRIQIWTIRLTELTHKTVSLLDLVDKRVQELEFDAWMCEPDDEDEEEVDDPTDEWKPDHDPDAWKHQ